MVIAFLHAHFDGVIGGVAGLLNEVRLELLFQKLSAVPWSMSMGRCTVALLSNTHVSYSAQVDSSSQDNE